QFEVIKGKAGEICGFTIDGVSCPGDVGIIDGNILEDGKTARTTAGSGAAFLAGSASSTQRLFAVIQVLAFTGSTLTLKVQSAPTSGFVSVTDQLTQSGITAVGGFYLTPLAGPITDTYFRANWSGTFTSFQAAVAIGIR